MLASPRSDPHPADTSYLWHTATITNRQPLRQDDFKVSNCPLRGCDEPKPTEDEPRRPLCPTSPIMDGWVCIDCRVSSTRAPQHGSTWLKPPRPACQTAYSAATSTTPAPLDARGSLMAVVVLPLRGATAGRAVPVAPMLPPRAESTEDELRCSHRPTSTHCGGAGVNQVPVSLHRGHPGAGGGLPTSWRVEPAEGRRSSRTSGAVRRPLRGCDGPKQTEDESRRPRCPTSAYCGGVGVRRLWVSLHTNPSARLGTTRHGVSSPARPDRWAFRRHVDHARPTGRPGVEDDRCPSCRRAE